MVGHKILSLHNQGRGIRLVLRGWVEDAHILLLADVLKNLESSNSKNPNPLQVKRSPRNRGCP